MSTRHDTKRSRPARIHRRPTLADYMDIPPSLTLGLSQHQFARRLGLSHSHVCRILNDQRNLTISVADRWAKLLGWTIDDLVNEMDKAYARNRAAREAQEGRKRGGPGVRTPRSTT